jgi:hypothetical protein
VHKARDPKGVMNLSRRSSKLWAPIFVLLLGLVAAPPAFAGSAVIGSVAGSMNATVGGQALLPNAVLFSGDSVQVKDGVVVVAIGKSSRMVFGRDTRTSFLKTEKEVTVLLGEGNVSIYHADDGEALRVKAGEVSVIATAGFKTLGEVAVLNGAVVVTAKEGSLVVENNRQTITVAKGKTVAISPKTARAPQGTATGGPHMSSGTTLRFGALAASSVSAVLSAVAVKRAGDARSSAEAANSAASSAVTAASNAAAAAANAASTANAVGLALNNLFCELGLSGPSPYMPPSGDPPCVYGQVCCGPP